MIAGYWERAEFPHHLVPSFAELGLAGGNIKGFGCPVSSLAASMTARSWTPSPFSYACVASKGRRSLVATPEKRRRYHPSTIG